MEDLSMVPAVKLESEMGEKLVVSKGKAACEEPIKLPEEPSPNGNTAFAWSTVKLESSDGEQFVVSREAAFMSGVVKSFVKDADESAMDEPIKISNVTGPILAKVLEYCKKHAEKPPSSSSSSSSSSDVYVYDYETDKWKEALSRWDREYCKMDQETLIDVILAANYMDVRDLLVETTKAVADQFKGKSPEEIREQFGIVNDYSPEDEARARQEVSWAFDHFVPDSCKKAGGNTSGKARVGTRFQKECALVVSLAILYASFVHRLHS